VSFVGEPVEHGAVTDGRTACEVSALCRL